MRVVTYTIGGETMAPKVMTEDEITWLQEFAAKNTEMTIVKIRAYRGRRTAR